MILSSLVARQRADCVEAIINGRATQNKDINFWLPNSKFDPNIQSSVTSHILFGHSTKFCMSQT